VTLSSTNTSIQAGRSLTEYGWDGLRRVITNLQYTAANSQWWIGTKDSYVTNSAETYSSPFTNLVNLVVSGVQDHAVIATANSWPDQYSIYARIGMDGYLTEAFSFLFATNAATTTAITNAAPSESAYAKFAYRTHYAIRYETEVSGGVMVDSNWVVTANTFYDYNNTTGSWQKVIAPVRSYYSNAPCARDVYVVLATNTTNSFLYQIIPRAANESDAVTSNYVPTMAFPDFRTSITSSAGYGSGGPPGGNGYLSLYWTMSAIEAGGSWTSAEITRSTNTVSPAVSIKHVINKWDFKYK
jgi:hypothetical protein